MDLMDYRRKIIANSPHLMSASGAVVSFSDGADNLPLKSLNVGIEPVQSGSGDPSPTNIRPISGWNGVKVTRTGKNLFSTFEDGDTTSSRITFDFSDSDVVKISGTSTANNASSQKKIIGGTDAPTPIEFIQGQTYTISLQGTVSVSKANDFRIILLSDSSTILWYGDSTNGVWTVTPESTFVAERIMFRIKSNGTTVNVDAHLQIELGSTATPYEPYNGVNVSIDLGQTVYGGTLNPLTGVLTVDKVALVIDGSEQYWYGVDNRPTIYDVGYTDMTFKGVHGTADIISNLGYVPTAYNYAQMETNRPSVCIRANENAQWRVYICTSETTLDGLKGSLETNPLQIVYPLATPYEIQLTPHQIRSLYGNNTIFADTGNVALEYWAHP